MYVWLPYSQGTFKFIYPSPFCFLLWRVSVIQGFPRGCSRKDGVPIEKSDLLNVRLREIAPSIGVRAMFSIVYWCLALFYGLWWNQVHSLQVKPGLRLSACATVSRLLIHSNKIVTLSLLLVYTFIKLLNLNNSQPSSNRHSCRI